MRICVPNPNANPNPKSARIRAPPSNANHGLDAHARHNGDSNRYPVPTCMPCRLKYLEFRAPCACVHNPNTNPNPIKVRVRVHHDLPSNTNHALDAHARRIGDDNLDNRYPAPTCMPCSLKSRVPSRTRVFCTRAPTRPYATLT